MNRQKNKELTQDVIEKRKKLKLTQRDVANRLGYNFMQSYNNFESGGRLLPVKKLALLQEVLQMTDEEMWNIVKNWN